MLAFIGVNTVHIINLHHINSEDAKAWEHLENASWIIMVKDNTNDKYGWVTWYTDSDPQEELKWGQRILSLSSRGAIQWHTGYPIWLEWNDYYQLNGTWTIIVLPIHGGADDIRVYK